VNLASRTPRRAALALSVLLGAAGAVALGATPAFAGPLSVTYTGPGAHDWTVPPGITSVTLSAIGGAGGNAGPWSGAGGAGAHVTETLAVTPGAVLHVHVGGDGANWANGAAAGGANGGGAGAGSGDYGAGAGGGATDVRLAGDDLTNRVLVAAGGGGGGFENDGGAAGQPGTFDCNGTAAQPGSDSAGGAGGAASTCGGAAGQDGSLGLGGDGAFAGGDGAAGGGGGGGGWYGGGGGNIYGGGAGGSSYTSTDATDASTDLAAIDAAPSLQISWATAPATTVQVITSPTDVPADGATTAPLDLLLTDDAGNPVAGDPLVLHVSNGDISSVVDQGDGHYTATYTAGTTAGDAVLTADDTYSPAVSAAGQLAAIDLTALPQSIALGNSAPQSAEVGTAWTPAATGSGTGAPAVIAILPSTTNSACTSSGTVITFQHAGQCDVRMSADGNAQYAATTADYAVTVDPSGTTTVVSISAGHLTATVTPDNPLGASPAGTVQFTVNGNVVGSADLANGVATLTHTIQPGSTATVSTSYSGSADYTASTSASVQRRDPVISAKVTSARPKTNGWYRTAVRVAFACQTRGAALAHPCPSPVSLTRQGRNETVTRTITAVDGGAATATVRGINIDTTAPVVRIGNVSSAHPTCVAHDALSGVASCRLTKVKVSRGVRWIATATDRAGNVARAVAVIAARAR